MKWLHESSDLVFQSTSFVASNFRALARCFWPVAVTMSALAGSDLILTEVDQGAQQSMTEALWYLTEVSASVVLAIYGFVIASSCAIVWHRFVQLNEVPGWSSLAPVKGVSRYFWHGALFLLILLFFQVPNFIYTISFLSSHSTEMERRRALIEMSAGQHFTMLVLAAFGGLLTLLFFARWLMVFPHIAVDARKFKPLRQRLHYPARFVGGAIIGYYAYYLMNTLVWLTLPIAWQSGENAFANFVVSVSGVLIGQVFAAWTITMLSQEYRSQLCDLADA